MRSHASTPPAPCNWLMLLLLLLSSVAADAPSEGCYERIAIGHRIKAADVITTLPTSSLSRCREACDKHPSNQCNSFGFGIGRKLNGTCELSSATIPTDPIPPFIRIESTSTLKLHSSKPGSPASPSNGTSEAPSSIAPSAAPTDASPENSTTSVSTPTNGNATDSKGTPPSEAENETNPPLATVADVDFDVYAKRPSSLCQRSPGAIDPWILRPLPSTPASSPPSSPSSPPPSPDSRPPSPSAPPSHPQNHHHNNQHHNHHHENHHNNHHNNHHHHHHGPGPNGPNDFRRPIPSNHLQPPPLFQTPSMQMPPYPFRPPQPSPPSASYMPPFNDGSFGPPPSQQGGFHPSPQQPPFSTQHHNHFPGPPIHNGVQNGGVPANGGFSHNGIPFGGTPPNGGPPYGGIPPNGHPSGGIPNAPPHGGVPNGGVGGFPNGGAPNSGPPHGGAPHDGAPHGGPPNAGGGPPFGGPPFAGPPPDSGTPHGAAPSGGTPNQPHGGGPQQPGSQHTNGDTPNFGDGANMIPHVPCFHRVTTGRLLMESLLHREMQAPNLDDCRRLCSIEHHFRCEGFLYRWDTRLCALTASPLSEIRFQEHGHNPSAEYFARAAIGHGICPSRDGGGSQGVRGPQGPGGWPSRDFGDGGSSVGRPSGGGASWGSSGGGSRVPQRGGSNGQQLPGFYGPPSADSGSGGGWAQQPEHTGPSDHRFDMRGGGGGGGSWGNRWRGNGGGGGGGGWNSGGGDGGRVRPGGHPPAGPPPASSSFRPVDRAPSRPSGPWTASGGGAGGWTKGHGDEDDECFVLVKRGFRLTPDGRPHPPPSDHEDAHSSDLVFMSVRVRSRDPEDCAKECYRSAMFRCDAFSYRFNGDPRTQGLSNCDLSGQPLKKLDPYKDLQQDRDYDVYGRTSGRACGDGAIMVGPQGSGGHLKRPPPPRGGGSDVHHPPPPPPPPPISRPPERPSKPAPPSYLDNSIGTGSGWSDSDHQNGGHKGQQDTTVGGRPCAHGSTCTRHPDGGFWGCPVSSFGLEKEASGSGRDWDYCCRPGHQCGYSEGYHLPWCYVGSADRDQWRPCSQEHYPPPSSTSSIASSSSHIDNTTIGNGHYHHDNHQNSGNQVAYLHSDKQNGSDNHTTTHHEHNDPHGVTSLVSMPHSDLKQQHNSGEADATIQKILDLLVSSGKDKDGLPVNEDNKLQTSIKSEEGNRPESRSGRGNRAYSRRTEEVRHFYPKYSYSRSKPRAHEIRDDYDEESEETRIIQSNFTVVEDTGE